MTSIFQKNIITNPTNIINKLKKKHIDHPLFQKKTTVIIVISKIITNPLYTVKILRK